MRQDRWGAVTKKTGISPGPMPARTMEKFVAVSLLEAARSALDHMGRWRMELSHRGETPSAILTTTYGSVRRLRDYVQSRLYIGGREVSWEMSEDDENLLVSCVGHYLRESGSSEEAPGLQGRGAAAFRLKQEDMIGVAVEMATREVVDLPAPKAGGMQGKAFQELRKAVIKKLRGPGENKLIAWGVPGGGAVRATPAPAAPSASPAVAESKPVMDEGALLDVRLVLDPHLRAIVGLDQRAFLRALRARDHRLATVHLFSLLEAVMLDYVLARRKELGLSGGPDAWNLHKLVLKLLGDETPEWELRALETICAAGNLISPLRQYTRPIVVTPSNSDLQIDVVKKVLVKLGYRGTAQGTPASRSATE